MKFSGKVGNGSVNKRLHFGGDPVRDPDTDPYRDTGKTCLDGGMYCPSASSLLHFPLRHILVCFYTRATPASAGISYGPLSVCPAHLSVTSRCSTETAKHRIIRK